MERRIREPKQARSIRKKELILKTGFYLICKDGFHNVNTDLIAKQAKVSTGIIYSYFIDKRDIFLQGMEKFSVPILFPLESAIKSHRMKPNNIHETLPLVIDKCIKVHETQQDIHESISMMEHIDSDVGEFLHQKEIQTANSIAKYIQDNGWNISNIDEKVHIIIGIVDSICHEAVFHKHQGLSIEKYKKETEKIICQILNEDAYE